MSSPALCAGRVVEPEVAYQQALKAGLIVHRAHPLNAETLLAALTGQAVISSGCFYIRNHFHIPDLDPATWRLRVSGLVERPLSLSLGQLQSMAAQTAVATLECAGNGRSVLYPPVPGEQWGLGAAGAADVILDPLGQARIDGRLGVLCPGRDDPVCIFRQALFTHTGHQPLRVSRPSADAHSGRDLTSSRL
jgi:Oxidoreductase molybdopterin binding domain